MSYFDELGGDLSLPDLPALRVSEQEWIRLVTAQREGGFASLTSAERATLLRGAVKSYLKLVSGTSRIVDVAGVGLARVNERYSNEGGLFSALSAREQTSSGMSTGWGDIVYREAGDHHIAQFVAPAGSTLIIEAWTFDTDESATCFRTSDSAGLGLTAQMYYSNLTTVVDDGGSWTRETLNGLPMEVLTQPYGQADQRVWLDERSLFPLRFEIPELRDQQGREFQPAKVLTITAINPDQVISRPDGSCDG